MIAESYARILELVGRVAIFLSRPQVRQQILLFLFILALSLVMTGLLWRLLLKPLKHRVGSEQGFTWSLLFINLIRATSFPIFGLFLVYLAINFLTAAGQVTGLLVKMSTIFYTILPIEIIIAFLYTSMDDDEIKQYRARFVVPFIAVFAFLQILNHLIEIRELGSIGVFVLFQNPVSLGSIFIATIGLYLYVDAINVFYTFAVNTIVRFSQWSDASVRTPLSLLRYFLIVLGIGFALGQLNLNATTIAAITGGLSVGIGFGLREIISNFIAGILLLFERSLKAGDVIEVDDEISQVTSLGIRATIVETVNRVEMVIPNQTFLVSKFKTYTGTHKHIRFPITIHASYENDMRRIITLLTRAAKAHPDVLSDPSPTVDVQDAFGDNVVTYRLHMWSDKPMQLNRIKSDVIQAIWASFQAHHISLTFPDMELHFNDTLAEKYPDLQPTP